MGRKWNGCVKIQDTHILTIFSSDQSTRVRGKHVEVKKLLSMRSSRAPITFDLTHPISSLCSVFYLCAVSF